MANYKGRFYSPSARGKESIVRRYCCNVEYAPQASVRFVEVAGNGGSPDGWDPRTQGLYIPCPHFLATPKDFRCILSFASLGCAQMDWDYPIGVGLPGLPGGPSAFQGSTFSPAPCLFPHLVYSRTIAVELLLQHGQHPAHLPRSQHRYATGYVKRDPFSSRLTVTCR